METARKKYLRKCHTNLEAALSEYRKAVDSLAIARGVVHGGKDPTIYFSYSAQDNNYSKLWADPGLQERYGFRVAFPPPGEPGQRVSL